MVKNVNKVTVELVAVLAVAVALSGHGQDFQNLDFGPTFQGPGYEVYYNGAGPQLVASAAEALPHWILKIGGRVQDEVFLNSIWLDVPFISLRTHHEGRYLTPAHYDHNLVHLSPMAYYDLGIGDVPVSITQTGVVPVGAQSLRIVALVGFLDERMPLTLEMNGQSVPLFALSGVALGTPSGYYQVVEPVVEFGADISHLAGTVADLSIVARATANTEGWPDGTMFGEAILHSISFSPEPIPEPASLALLSLGALGLVVWRGRRHASVLS